MLSIGEYLDRLMAEKGFTYRSLDKISGVSYGTLNDITKERVRDPKLSTVIALSKALQVDLKAFAAAYEGKDPEAYQAAPTPEPEPSARQLMFMLEVLHHEMMTLKADLKEVKERLPG